MLFILNGSLLTEMKQPEMRTFYFVDAKVKASNVSKNVKFPQVISMIIK